MADTGDYNFPDVAGGGRGTVNPPVVVTPPRPASDTFVSGIDTSHVKLAPGGTLSDIVALQNKAGNPITADDLRAANPELGINKDATNLPAGASLQVPVRVGDNLVTTQPDGSTLSTNTKTGETLTVTHNADGTTTQTTSSTDGEFTRTVRTITFGPDESITSEERYTVNTLDNTRTPLSNDGATVADPHATTTDAATAQIIDAFSNPVVLPGGGVQLADAGTGTVSDAGTGITVSGGNASATNDSLALVDTGTPAPETVATSGNPTPPPIDTSGPDGSDAHFANHPPTLDVAGLTADLTFASTLIGLKNWGSQDDLGGFGAGLVKGGNPIAVAGSGASFSSYVGLVQNIEHGNVLGTLASINGCYAFESGLRIFHAGQLSKKSANSPDWGICA